VYELDPDFGTRGDNWIADCFVMMDEQTMTRKPRRKIDAALKAKIALEAAREQATVADLAERHEIHGFSISQCLHRRFPRSNGDLEAGPPCMSPLLW
jgi:hypothetical protein